MEGLRPKRVAGSLTHNISLPIFRLQFKPQWQRMFINVRSSAKISKFMQKLCQIRLMQTTGCDNYKNKSFWIYLIHRLVALLGHDFVSAGIHEGLMDFRSFTGFYTLAIQVL